MTVVVVIAAVMVTSTIATSHDIWHHCDDKANHEGAQELRIGSYRGLCVVVETVIFLIIASAITVLVVDLIVDTAIGSAVIIIVLVIRKI